MINYKKKALEQAIVKQEGEERLLLNDIIINLEGAEIVAALIPRFHPDLRHIEIKGNNIDSEGFQIILTALLHCSHLKSFVAEWNHIGSSSVGLQTLVHLVRKLHYLEFIDLKNNRISHHLTPYLAEIIQADRPNLRVIDLRWNEIGELGANNIIEALSTNHTLRFLGLEDNRISSATLLQIESMLKSAALGQNNVMKHSQSNPGRLPQYYPISGDGYEGIDLQLKSVEMRSKIDHEQKEGILQTEKLEVEIQKMVNRMKLRGAQNQELSAKYQSLLSENRDLIDSLRQAERAFALAKEGIMGIERSLNDEKSSRKAQKYRLNHSIQGLMEKYTQRNQVELEEIELVMGQKLERLNMYLKERLHQKRKNREKIADMKEDIVKSKLGKEDSWNKGASFMGLSMNNAWQEECFALQQLVNRTKSSVSGEEKKGSNYQKQLKGLIIKALKGQQRLQQQIFEHQNKIKDLHNEMTLKNMDNQLHNSQLKILQSKQFDHESTINMQKQYLNHISSKKSIDVEVQHMKQHEIGRTDSIEDCNIDIRIEDLERALRAQQVQNKMIKNQYEKLMSLVENTSKKTIQEVLFD